MCIQGDWEGVHWTCLLVTPSCWNMSMVPAHVQTTGNLAISNATFFEPVLTKIANVGTRAL